MTVRNNQAAHTAKKMTMRDCISATFAISTSTFALPALAVSMIAISSSAYADSRINNISVVQTAPAVTQLRLGFSTAPVLPTAYQLADPNRLVLDFDKVQNGLNTRATDYNIGMVKDVTALNSDNTTRLIVGLKQEGSYATTVSGNDLLLTLTEPNRSVVNKRIVRSTATPIVSSVVTPIVTTPTSVIVPNVVVTPDVVIADTNRDILTTPVITPIIETSSVAVAPIVTGSTTVKNQTPADTMVVRVNPLLDPRLASSQVSQQYSYDGLSAVNFAAGGNGGGNVTIALNNEAIPVDVQRQGNKLIVRLTGSTVPRNLLRRLNVNSGLVSSIDTSNQGQNGVITINMNADYEYQAFQSGNQLNIGISKPELLREPTLEEKIYKGEALSMEFQDVEIRTVLDILAQFTEMNIVASDSVAGSITLRLINVPWDQALDIILKSKNLGKRENGNVILVAPTAELAAQEAQELEAQQVVEAFEPLRTEYIRLSYAKAADVLSLISQGSGSSNNSGNNSGTSSNRVDNNTLLSNRGTVTVDDRTNTLIIKDVGTSIENIHKLISKIDIPVRQVMIEARIVSASDSFSKEIGVRWGILSNGAANNRNLLVGGSNQTITDLKDFKVESTTINGQTVIYPKYEISRPDNLNVDLGVANPAGRIAFGLLGISDFMLDLELSAMQAENRGEVVSTPKILTADKQLAKISSGTLIPYQESAGEGGGTKTTFKEAALSLEATPSITPDGKIGLLLNIKNGRPTQVGNQIGVAEDSLSTNIIVEDGQTVVLGGVFRNRTSNGVEKVPFLGDLPYIGQAFRRNMRNNEKDELLIFITTKLINDGISRLD